MYLNNPYIQSDFHEERYNPQLNLDGGSNTLQEKLLKPGETFEQWQARIKKIKNPFDATIPNPNKLNMNGLEMVLPFASTALRGLSERFDRNKQDAYYNQQLNDGEFNPTFSYTKNDYGQDENQYLGKQAFKQGGTFEEGGESERNEFDAYDFLFGDDGKVDNAKGDERMTEASVEEQEQKEKQLEQQRQLSKKQEENDLVQQQLQYQQNDDRSFSERYPSNNNTSNIPNDVETRVSGTLNYPQQLQGSSAAARNNNPGNILYASWMQKYGAVKGSLATDSHMPFAKFPTVDAAMQARADLLKRPHFINTEFDAAMRMYSGRGYSGNIYPELKGKKIGELTEAELQELTRRQIKREDGKVAKQLGIYEQGGEYDLTNQQILELSKKGYKFDII